MISLLNSIFSAFSTNGALTSAFPGGLHRDKAPEGTAMPYVVSKVVSAPAQFAYGAGSRTLAQVKFAVLAVGHDVGGLLAEALAGQFDGNLLTLSSGTNDTVIRLGDPIPAMLSPDGQGNDVWEWSVTYEYGVTS